MTRPAWCGCPHCKESRNEGDGVQPLELWEPLGEVSKHPEGLEIILLPVCARHSMLPIKPWGLFLHLCPEEEICGAPICLFQAAPDSSSKLQTRTLL